MTKTMTKPGKQSREKRLHPALKPACAAVLTAWCGLTILPAHALDANALPTNGQITAGSGSISQSGNAMTVNQSTDRMAATWNTFNIGSNASVNFVQPSSSSVALNRVTSGDASQIFGQLNANGQVYLINPSGILFGQGASVNVGGLVASTLNMSDANFMTGKNVFELEGANGSVVNRGNITAADGGYVALLGAQVRNEGNIVARLGSVVLAAGEKMTLDFNGDGLINVEVSNATLNANVVNQGVLQADGGTVIMTARATDAMLSNVVNNSGVIEATSLQNRNGAILLDGGDSGVVANSGTLDVSGKGSGATGGTVKALGRYVGLFDGTRIDASGDAGGGTVLVGGNYQGSGTEHQSEAVYMGADAAIKADAIRSGNGGSVVLWSTASTRFYGDISAQSNGATGRGGTVETSGHDLEVNGLVHLGATSGLGGDWLIDPYNINITTPANAGGATTTNPFTSSGAASSNLSSATLNASLSEGANVRVYTTSVGGTSGDINVQDDVKAVGNATLTLQAHRNIVMTNHSISNADGKSLNVSLFSNFNNSGNGSIALSNGTISTNGGYLTMSGGLDPATGSASTVLNSTSGVSITNGSVLDTGGGDVTIRGAIAGSATSNSSAVQISGSTIDAGGGNITILANQASATGDAFVMTAGSRIVTNGSGSISIDSTNLGNGNGTRIFSTNNTIAATGSGDLTISGNATSGYGVLVCSTAATSSQTLTVGSGTLTVKANSNGFAGAGRGVYLAASGTGSVTLNATAGGSINVVGNSTGSYGTVLNSSGAGSLISIATAGDINIAGNTSGGTTPALALISSGNGSSPAAGSRVNVSSSAGNITLTANNSVINTSSGSFKALSIDVGGQYAAVNINTWSGNISLNGTSASGRGVDIAPSALNAVVNIGATSGNIAINGNSTNSFGGYGIFFNSTNGATGVNVTTLSGDITLRGDSVGTSDAIALGGSGTASTNNISSQGGNITLNGNFHSPNVPELDHGIAILGVTNKIQTTGSGNVTLIGNAADQGDGVSFYGSGNALVSVENGALSVTGSSVYGDGLSILTGSNVLRATGSGSVSLSGASANGGGITIYPSTNASSATIATNTGKLTLTGTSGSASSTAGITIRSPGSGATAGVRILSGSGDIALTGTADESGEGITFIGSSTSGFNTVATGGSGNMTVNASSKGSYGLRFNGGTNSLLVADGILFITASAPNGAALGQSGDATTFAATGNGVVIMNFGKGISNLLTNAATAPVTTALQTEQAGSAWNRPSGNSNVFSPFNESARRLSIDIAMANGPAAADAPTTQPQTNPQGKDDDAQ
ncbi:filamentous hemagglutinin N-terminal domain-containing protein [Herbaspirillum sp. RV1423]|uniref:beta strand repeat-containing protein n=1 Tax=Herbaspirillum sp. RV1423 TaxID=1443993 RepID=UPI0006869919|nr:filamentous hemagglutinin N-terminal domain-containing protein [Herbaspirillum sp. RV1423]